MALTAGDAQETGRTNDTRATILRVAAELLERFTIQKLTMEDVARAAGVTRQTVYKHFRGKDDLVAELIVQEMETKHAPLMEKLARKPATPERLVDVFLQQLEVGRGFGLFDPMLDPSRAPRTAELVFRSDRVFECLDALWLPILEKYEAAGVLREGRDKKAIIRWFTYNQFWLLTHPTVLCDQDDPKQLRHYASRFIVGAVVRDGT